MVETSRKWSQIVPAIGATLGAFGCGNVLAWPAPALPYMDTVDCKETCDIPLTTEQASWVAAVAYLGCICAGPLAGTLMPRIGQRWTMILLSLPFIAGLVFIICAEYAKDSYIGQSEVTWAMIMLFIGRLLTGLSGGAFGLLAPSYTSEIAEPSIKGALGSLQQLTATLGVLFVTVVGKFQSWQTLTKILLVVPTIMAIWMFFMPESPVFLISKGRRDDAKKSLLFLRGPKFNIEKELAEIELNVRESKKAGSVGLVTLITNKEYLLPILISMVVMFLQQFSGVNAVISYAVQIFEDAGLEDTLDPFICNILVALSQSVFVVVSMLLVDRFGRKVLLVVSDFLMGVCLLGLGVYFYLQFEVEHKPGDDIIDNPNATVVDITPYISENLVSDLSPVPLVSLLAFIGAFSIGLGPLPWVLNSELFSKEAKAPGSAFCTSINWTCCFLVVKFYPTAELSLHTHNTYFFFGAVCLAGALFIWGLVPETKGKTEEDMKEYFMGVKRDNRG